MNKAKLKSYAPAARRDFIQAVTDRAHFFGLSEKEITPVEESGDIAIIGGRPFPRSMAFQRNKLEERVTREGFNQVMEAIAYTWFNRFLALRYMELHGYLEHGYRVLSNTGSSITPEILEHAAELDLPGLDRQKVVELKLDGSKDAELYRMLLVAQCNALHAAMPFLFERIDDETELLLPDNLLHSDSLIRKLVTEIEEEDWQEVEIIGWLYQFYISEKKDQVIGKVVKSEDIPAATQLFTPNWIVKYMVQNSLGRKWLATYPNSPLKAKMEYYIEPAEQTEEVKAHLAAITPDSLDPEELTLLDPACGSGHILVVAYDILKEIYLERGYGSRDFPRLILEKNLFGLDIDGRAAQMAGFALLMKARKDDRRILRSDNSVKLNVMAIQETRDIGIESSPWAEHSSTLCELVEFFRDGKTFGSLLQLPEQIAVELPIIEKNIIQAILNGNLYVSHVARALLPLIEQAKILAGRYDFVVANPPYMGANYMNPMLRAYASRFFPEGKSDLYSMFILRIIGFTKPDGYSSLMTPFTWMNLSSFADLRSQVLRNLSLTSLIKPEYHSFFDSAYVPICSFSIQNTPLHTNAVFIDLSHVLGEENQAPNARMAITDPKCKWRHLRSTEDFTSIPSKVIAYSLGEHALKCFKVLEPLSHYAELRQGLITGDNDYFLRFWQEVDFSKSSLVTSNNNAKWFPYQKGGAFRKWYGNHDYFVNWEDSGAEIRSFVDDKGKLRSRPQNIQYYFREGLTWTSLTISSLTMRYVRGGFIFDAKGPMCFSKEPKNLFKILGYANSKVIDVFLKELAPTMDFSQGPVGSVPFINNVPAVLDEQVEKMIAIAKRDWDFFETSWDFKVFPLLDENVNGASISESWENWRVKCISQTQQLQELEIANNRIFIDAFGLQDELSPDVTEEQITLGRADLQADMKRLISYASGCMMGRYSLDQPGLVYANSGNIGFDPTKYNTFPSDDDGIVPVMDIGWFPDDAASRFEEFLKVAWSPETLEENLKFVADSLSPKNGETPRETIRRYIGTQFFRDHLQTYKKRPIYWLFSSGKQRAFECLVYLHRYNESTLSRMRNEYVTPLQGKFSAQVEYLANEVTAATSTAERNRLQKQLDTLRKKQVELAGFDDLLRHYADQRISLDLDDGVKVNYGKFGGLLAEVKAVTGGKED